MAHKRYTSGFTLMELMIALALGLLIVAAGLAVFLSSQRSLNLQSGMSELQQNANFGLSLVTHDLRHTNLNTLSEQKVNSRVIGSGIIFKKKIYQLHCKQHLIWKLNLLLCKIRILTTPQGKVIA